MNNFQTAVAFSLLTIILSACSSKSDLSDANFSEVIKNALLFDESSCVKVGSWPLEISPEMLNDTSSLTHVGPQILALEAVGLMSGTDVVIDEKSLWSGLPTGKKLNVRRFSFTDLGQKYQTQKIIEQPNLQGGVNKITTVHFCYAKPVLVNIVSWGDPITFGGVKEVNVVFTTKLSPIADWATKKVFLDSFPVHKQLIESRSLRTDSMPMVLTENGWRKEAVFTYRPLR